MPSTSKHPIFIEDKKIYIYGIYVYADHFKLVVAYKNLVISSGRATSFYGQYGENSSLL